MAQKKHVSPYADANLPNGPWGAGKPPKKTPAFGKAGNVDKSDAGRDETESVPSLGANSKKPFVMPQPSQGGRLVKGKE